MENDYNNFESIISENKKANQLLKELLELKESLENKENALNAEYHQLNRVLVKINNDINVKRDHFDRIINGNHYTDAKLSSEYINQKSLEIVNQFLLELEDSKLLQFKIEYGPACAKTIIYLSLIYYFLLESYNIPIIYH